MDAEASRVGCAASDWSVGHSGCSSMGRPAARRSGGLAEVGRKSEWRVPKRLRRTGCLLDAITSAEFKERGPLAGGDRDGTI